MRFNPCIPGIALFTLTILAACGDQTDDGEPPIASGADAVCELSPVECHEASRALLRAGRRDPEQQAAGNAYRQQACDRGHLLACAFLGFDYVRGVEGVDDPEYGMELLQGACDQGFLMSCTYLVMASLTLDLPEEEYQFYKDYAFRVYLAACEGDNPDGCIFVATRHRHDRNFEAQRDILRYGCERGSTMSCERYREATGTDP